MGQKVSATDPATDYEPTSHAASAPHTTTPALAHTETDGDAYVYESLNKDRPSIRLITVWHGPIRASYPYPSTESDEIMCTIDTFEADEAPSYVALSYTWGNPIPLHTIRLNGKHFSIRENLFDFLNAFGASEPGQQSHHLWIDQLCIDQSNNNERGHQVQMMGDIYRNAQFVISWLDRSCLEAFRDLASGHFDLYLYDQYVRAITIFSNQYFSRLWVVQKVLLAKEVKFMCGDAWINYQALVRLSLALDRRWWTPECVNALGLFETKEALAGNNWSFVYVLNHGGSMLRCEDGRDQVYGLLGIVGSSHHVPEVNYQDSVQQVYLDTVRIILTESQTQTVDLILGCAGSLAGNMCLPLEQLLAIHELIFDIKLRVVDEVNVCKSIPSRPIIHAIGFSPSESPVEWWYEHQGVRYGFPV